MTEVLTFSTQRDSTGYAMVTKHASYVNEFAKFLDLASMRVFFQNQLPNWLGKPVVISDCIRLHTDYKRYLSVRSHGKSCLSICYQIDTPSDHVAGAEPIIIYIKAYLEGRGATEYAQVTRRQAETADWGPAIRYYPEMDFIAWRFPCDVSLPTLTEVIEPKGVVKYLPYSQMPEGFKDLSDIEDVVVKVVGYRPETRCTIRYDLYSSKQNTKTCFSLYGKILQGNHGRIVNDRMQALWDVSLENPGNIYVAQPLGYSDTVKTVWQQAANGTALRTILNKYNYKNYLEKVAKGLAFLHQCKLKVPPALTDHETVKDARKKARKVSQEFPDLEDRFRALVDYLESKTPLAGSYTNTLIHGDIHLKQLLLHDHNIYFFDFDEFALGDPLQDLAQFIVDIHLYDFDTELVDAMSNALLSRYREHVQWEVPLERLIWRIRIQLINKASRYIKQQEPQLSEKINQLLAMAEYTISHGLTTFSIPVEL